MGFYLLRPPRATPRARVVLFRCNAMRRVLSYTKSSVSSGAGCVVLYTSRNLLSYTRGGGVGTFTYMPNFGGHLPEIYKS